MMSNLAYTFQCCSIDSIHYSRGVFKFKVTSKKTSSCFLSSSSILFQSTQIKHFFRLAVGFLTAILQVSMCLHNFEEPQKHFSGYSWTVYSRLFNSSSRKQNIAVSRLSRCCQQRCFSIPSTEYDSSFTSEGLFFFSL